MRVQKLQSIMKENNVDYCLITDSLKLKYFTGFKYSVAERLVALLVSQNSSTLIVNKLFDIYDIKNHEVIFYYDHQDPMQIINDIVNDKLLAIDTLIPGRYLMNYLKINTNLNYVRGDIIDFVKAVKSDEEVEIMRQSSAINDAVMQKVYDFLHIGVTEIEVSDFIKDTFNEYGVDGLSFTPIVAFKENGADPHARVSNRKLNANESIIIDMGCIYKGYCSDMTRTFFIGDCDIKEEYALVLKANEEAIKLVKPNIMFKELDACARNIISDAGYGEYFTHRLGHGIGMSTHEPFDVNGINDMKVQENMAFSIEPGIYVKDKFGIRIEDIIIVTKDGYENLNKFSKELMIKPID